MKRNQLSSSSSSTVNQNLFKRNDILNNYFIISRLIAGLVTDLIALPVNIANAYLLSRHVSTMINLDSNRFQFDYAKQTIIIE